MKGAEADGGNSIENRQSQFLQNSACAAEIKA